MARKHVRNALVLPAIAWVAAACAPGGSPGGFPRGVAVPVKLSVPRTATIDVSSDFVARLESRQSVRLQPQVSGRIARVYVASGDRVAAGAPLIQIDPAQQQATLSSRLAQVESSRADLESAQAQRRSLEALRNANRSNLRFAEQEYQRFSALAAEGASTRQNLERARNALETAKATLAQTEADIRAQQAAIARAERQLQQFQASAAEQQLELQYFTVSAPFAGNVGDIPVKVGDYVSPASVLLAVTQNETLELKIPVPIERAPQLRVGMPVQVLDARGQPKITSNISFIAPSADAQTQSVLVKALLDNASNVLRSEQFVTARVIWEKRPGLLVPTSAIARLGGQNFVFVTEMQKAPGQAAPKLVARQKPVTLGRIVGNDQEVLEGLKPGEKFVVAGILQLQDGVPVMPDTGGAPPPSAQSKR